MKITPVLLAGGSGTRLWPLSRKSYPKQFSPLMGKETLFQGSARRMSGSHGAIEFAPPMVLTNADFRFIVTEQLTEAGIDPGAILIEPTGRNTAPAVLAAALYLAQSDPDALMLVAPSDHVIPDRAAFVNTVAQGLSAVAQGDLVTFGIPPTRAETGYGYLELEQSPDTSGTPMRLNGFVEKPDAAKAQTMIAAGTYLWNAGIFLFAVKDMLAAFQKHAATLIPPVQAALDAARPDLGFLRLDPDAWSKAANISIDYAVMEHASNLSVVPYLGDWSDLGGWDAVWRESGPDIDGLVLTGPATAIDCRDSLLRSENEGQQIVGIGLDNIVAIAMPDAVLIAEKSRAGDVGRAVAALREKGALQAEAFPKDHRPWGWFESLVVGGQFQVKRIVVQPGQALSLQSHVHRAEHWVVVEGTAHVTLDGQELSLGQNQSMDIPRGARHRLANRGDVPMVLIEVQTGAYLGEDDITRYADDYARG